MITISKDEYADLLWSAQVLQILKRTLYESADASFIDNKLTIRNAHKDDALDALKVLDDFGYALELAARRKANGLDKDRE